jgi:hypothetical protein
MFSAVRERSTNTHYFSNNFIHLLITARKSFPLDFTSFAL